jgi:hypothetical protein
MHLPNQIPPPFSYLCTEAPGHNDTPVLGKSFANRVQTLFDRIIDKSAGVHYDQIGTLKRF